MKYVFIFTLSLFVFKIDASDLKVGLPENSLPFSTITNDQTSGVIGEAATIIFKKMGHQLSPKSLPFSRLFYEIEIGKIDVALQVLALEERKKAAFYSDPIITDYDILIIPKNKKFIFNSISDLSGKILGARHGIIYPRLKNIKVSYLYSQTIDQEVDQLLNGRVDAAIINSIFGIYQLNQTGLLDKIDIVPLAIEAVPLSIALSKNKFTEKDLQDFNKILGTFLKSEEWIKIKTKYNIKSLVYDFPLAP